jgi:hypothetical protein
MANGITRYSLHPEIVQLIFGHLLSRVLFFEPGYIVRPTARAEVRKVCYEYLG